MNSQTQVVVVSVVVEVAVAVAEETWSDVIDFLGCGLMMAVEFRRAWIW